LTEPDQCSNRIFYHVLFSAQPINTLKTGIKNSHFKKGRAQSIMKAVLCKELTGYENLSLEDIDSPSLGDDEVLIGVKIAALNFFDTLITKGKYQFKPDLPFSPSGEIAGIVRKVGRNVTGFDVNDRVMAYIGWGGLQEQIAVGAEKLTKIPSGVGDDVGAGLIITYGTAMHGLVDRAKVRRGDTVVVLGASGGAGLAAVEVAHALGARVIAVASDDEKLQLTKEHGADLTVNSKQQDLKTTLKSLTEGQGVDVVYDCVGGELAEPCLRAVKWNGRYLVVGFASGDIPAVPFNLIMLKGIHVQGVFFGRYLEEQPSDYQRDVGQLLKWVEEGAIRPHLEAVYPLTETKTALGILAQRKAKGKIVIQVS